MTRQSVCHDRREIVARVPLEPDVDPRGVRPRVVVDDAVDLDRRGRARHLGRHLAAKFEGQAVFAGEGGCCEQAENDGQGGGSEVQSRLLEE